MKKEELRIVYMGTPDFAVEPLRRLVEHGYNIVGVVTMPDKPAGRGHHVRFSPVKEYAVGAGLTVLQPERLRDEQWLAELQALRADLQIVVAFRMLPEVVWAMPRLGTFNLHASLLPEYRGAAPINRAIMNGETRSGVTTFFLRQDIDTGDIILQQRVDIEPHDNAGTLHDKLMAVGTDLVEQTVDMILADAVVTRPQPELAPKPAPKIFKDDCRLDFALTARELHNRVRGLSPYPAAWAELRPGLTVKIFASHPEPGNTADAPGTVICDGRTLRVACADGYLAIDEIQAPGRRRMTTAEFLRGYQL